MIGTVGVTDSRFTQSNSDKYDSKMETELLKSSSFTLSGDMLTFEVMSDGTEPKFVTVDLASSKHNEDVEIRESLSTISMIENAISEQGKLCVDYMTSTCLSLIVEIQKKFDTYIKNFEEGQTYLCPNDEKIVRSASNQLHQLTTMIPTCTYPKIQNIIDITHSIFTELSKLQTSELITSVEISTRSIFPKLSIISVLLNMEVLNDMKNYAYKMIVIRLKQLLF
jgi:hypothetical protein